MLSDSSLNDVIQQLSVWFLPALIAITFHEAAHGWVAWRLGDDTAMREGRVTFNPLRHIDPVGTLLLPGMLVLAHAPFLFGWAKPVPIAFYKLKRPRRDMVLVAAAGPGINLALAFGAALGFHLVPLLPDWVGLWLAENLRNAVIANVLLAVFNMIPIPPLDGGRVAVGILPSALAIPLARMERVGLLLVMGIFILLPMIGSQLHMNLNVVPWILGPPVDGLLRVVSAVTGA